MVADDVLVVDDIDQGLGQGNVLDHLHVMGGEICGVFRV